MIAEISAGLSGLKAAKDIVQALSGIQNAASVNDAKLTLQGHILDAQQALFAAQEAQSAGARRIAELEQEIVRLKDWETEKQRYQMKRFLPGSVAYCLKPEMAAGEPPHRICPSCYHEGKKGFFQAQPEIKSRGRVHLCTSCRTEAVFGQEMTDAEEPTTKVGWEGPVSAGPRTIRP
jgi:hypothetical protein